jgi:hypothetical protein
MALPNVVVYSLPVGNATTIAQVQASTNGPLQLNGTLGTSTGGVLGVNQQRITVSSSGNDGAIGIAFKIIGLNQAGFTVSEILPAGNATVVAQSNLDYRTVLSIAPVNITSGLATTTVSTIAAGTNGVGSTLWNIANWHVTPFNIGLSGQLVTSGIATAAASWTIEYTFDDPNNLPVGILFPNPIAMTAFGGANGTTVAADANFTTPCVGTRLKLISGTGTVRYAALQAGLYQ